MGEPRNGRRRTGAAGCALALLATLAGGGSSGVGWADPGDQLWEARYNGPVDSYDAGTSLAASPDGTRIYVTGDSSGSGTADDYTTVAYDAPSGGQLWEARYDGPGNSWDYATSIAASPDGTRVFVTGGSIGSGAASDYATIGYDAATGAQLWEARYNGPANSRDVAYSLAPSPDGARVYVTGESNGSETGEDYATIAYDAESGAPLWEARYNGTAGYDWASSLGVSPDGTRVFVTGVSSGPGTGDDYATIAFDATGATTGTPGAQLWVARYNGPGNSDDQAISLAPSPDGSRVFVTGRRYGSETGSDYATVAYDAATGAQIWEASYNGPANSDDLATSLGLSPDGTRVFVTGGSYGFGTDYDYATISYDASSGAQLWEARYNGPPLVGYDLATSLAVSPDGSGVFVTGASIGSGINYDYATVAYDAPSGAQIWEARYNGASNSDDLAFSVAPSPDGARVFVTGRSYHSGTDYDYATIAYDAPSGAACTPGNYAQENGPLSGPVHGTVEPAAGGLRPTVHQVNCDVVAANGL